MSMPNEITKFTVEERTCEVCGHGFTFVEGIHQPGVCDGCEDEQLRDVSLEMTDAAIERELRAYA